MSEPYEDCPPADIETAAGDPGNSPVDPSVVADAIATAIAEAFGGLDGTLDVELALPDCLKVTNCDGESLTVTLDPASIDALTAALDGLTVTLENAQELADLIADALDGLTVTIDGPVETTQDCTIGFVLIEGCLDGECVYGIQTVEHCKSSGATTVLGDTLPDGATAEPCPCIVELVLPVACCDIRKTLTDGTFNISAELDVGPGYTVPTFNLNVYKLANKANPAVVVDCAGNKSEQYCGQNISFAGGECSDQHDLIQTITLGPGDFATLQARVCPPVEAL